MNTRFGIPRLNLFGSILTRHLSIRARLIVLTLAVGLPFLLYIGINTSRQLALEREHSKEQTLAIARLIQTRLDETVDTIKQLLTTTAYSAELSNADPVIINQLIQKMKGQIPAYLYDVAFWDAQGNKVSGLVERDPTQARPNIANLKFFQDTLTSTEVHIVAPVRSQSRKVWLARFGYPVLNNGRVIGIVTASIELEQLKSFLDPQGSLPKDAVITILGPGSVVIARSIDPEKWIGQVPNVKRQVNPADKEAVVESTGIDGMSRIAAFVKTKTVPWTLLVGIPVDTALAASKNRLYENLLMSGGALLLALLLASLCGRSIVAPIEQLTRDARRIGEGQLAHRSKVQTSGEMSLLASSMNQMAQAIQERTSALERSEEWLKQMTDNMPALVSYLDHDLRFRFANQAYQEWLGTEPGQLIGQSVREFYGEETYALIAPHLEAGLSGQHVSYERKLKTTTSERHVLVTIVPHLLVPYLGIQKVVGLYVLMTDITARKHIEMEHAKVQERLSLALEGSQLALFDWDLRTQQVYLSPMWSLMRGGPAVESFESQERLLEQVHPEDMGAVKLTLVDTLKGISDYYDVEHRVRMFDGSWLWVRSRGRVVERDAEGRALRVAGTNVDIHARKQTEQHLKYLAEVDTLTQLPNRACFMERMTEALQIAEQRQSNMALLFIDIDYFKQINDSHGHEAGDMVLQNVAMRLNNLVRSTDTVARLGGDEFTVILNDLRCMSDAQHLLRKLLAAIREPMKLIHKELSVTVSVGMAYRANQNWDGPTLLRNADSALYEVKRQGRNGYYIYTDEETPGLKLVAT